MYNNVIGILVGISIINTIINDILSKKKRRNNFKQINKKKLSLNFNPILKNIDSLTQFYIKNN